MVSSVHMEGHVRCDEAGSNFELRAQRFGGVARGACFLRLQRMQSLQ